MVCTSGVSFDLADHQMYTVIAINIPSGYMYLAVCIAAIFDANYKSYREEIKFMQNTLSLGMTNKLFELASDDPSPKYLRVYIYVDY